MGAIFFESDNHVWHDAIGEYCNRPFSTTEECAEAMLANHNKRVKNGDTAFFVGDYWFGNRTDGRMKEYTEALNGDKVLILGNHDRASNTKSNGWRYQREYLDAGFAAVVDYATVTLPQVKGGAPARRVLVSHYPYRADHKDTPRYNQYRLRDEGLWLIHGHVHDLYTVRDRGVNVGVDSPFWNFAPAQDHEIARLIDDIESGRREEF